MLADTIHRPLKNRRNRRGSAMLEGAFVFGALVFLIVGTVDIANILVTHQSLTQRVRDAARWGVARTYNEAGIRNRVLYGTEFPSEGARAMASMTATNVEVTVLLGGTDEPDRLQVRVTGWAFRTFSPYIAGLRSGTAITVSMPVETP